MKQRKTINKGVWIFAAIIGVLGLAGLVVTLWWQQWRHAACYFLIVAGISLFLYSNRKAK